jgi:hypothetical protein
VTLYLIESGNDSVKDILYTFILENKFEILIL